jgi:hypothetical protein
MMRLEDLTENQMKHLKESLATSTPAEVIRQPLESAQRGLAEASEDIEQAKSRFPDTAERKGAMPPRPTRGYDE